ncbi:MAG: hypothetical protein A2X36_08165 [Elusimicrobia bacterium GWA2_69_24]|nr:MAG: hypothetical protein A2X36_08165 [Elusimicrobia bacterium GWA2_69_24]HBL16899.1 hypothetical protein [Elusimicrobiota bacterium]
MTARDRILTALGVVLSGLLVPATARAGFEDLGAGARPMGMANAFTAVADDASAMHFNPAGLAGLSRPEAAASYSRLYMGLEDGSQISHSWLGYAHPVLRAGTFAAGILDQKLSGFFEERSYLLSYARALRGGLSAGSSLRVLERKYSIGSDPHLADDPLFREHGTSSRGVGLDLGVLYRSSGPVSVGLALLNLNEPDLGLAMADPVRRSVKLGFAYRPRDFTFGSDLALQDGDWDVLFGAERWFLRGTLAGRLGLGFGSRSDRDLSAGATFRGPFYQLDYAFQMPLGGIAGTSGTHRFTLGVRFGRPAPEEDAAPAAAAPAPTPLEERLKDLGLELEQNRKTNEATQELLQRLEKRFTAPPKPREAEAPPAPKKAAPPAKPKSYTVTQGDTLKSVAEKIYGNSARWMDLYRVNQDRIGAGGKLTAGQELVIP